MTVVNRNIVVLPPSGIAEQAISYSERLTRDARDEVAFTLNSTNFRPHITIHQFAIPSRNLERLDKAISEAVENLPPATVQMRATPSLFGGTFVFWDTDQNPESNELFFWHRVLLEVVNPLCEGWLMSQHTPFLDPESGIDIGVDHRRSLRKHGIPLAGDQYYPHITLTAGKKVTMAKNLSDTITLPSISFEVDGVWLTEVGPSGTCPASAVDKKFIISGN